TEAWCVATVEFCRGEAEAIANHVAEPGCREQPIVPTQQEPRRHLWPGGERPGLLARSLRLAPSPRDRLPRQGGRDVLVEDLDVAGVLPSLRSVAGVREHLLC